MEKMPENGICPVCGYPDVKHYLYDVQNDGYETFLKIGKKM